MISPPRFGPASAPGRLAVPRYLAQQVAKFFFFRAEIILRLGGSGRLAGDPLDDLNASAFQGGNFFRIVGEQAHLADADVAEDGGGEGKITGIGGKAELPVGLDRIQALVLQDVGTKLVHQADAAAFLLLIE